MSETAKLNHLLTELMLGLCASSQCCCGAAETLGGEHTDYPRMCEFGATGYFTWFTRKLWVSRGISNKVAPAESAALILFL